ncbi:MAG: ferrous iron transport protein B [Tidjanibacter sp.]|nr:ferrous iron transport protein B [Tidjanibacter sp.]
MYLSELQTGESAVIVKVSGHGGFRRRILEMGFVRGETITSILNAPLNDPVKYKLMGYEVSLRRNEARMIEVMTEQEAEEYFAAQEHFISYDYNVVQNAVKARSHEINIALVGNPNSGKTSIFNALSGGHEHVGNYSGVTVDAKFGQFKYRDYKFNVTDLPGTYALSAYTPEELYVRRHLMENTPDVIINTVVASNIERNLFLTSELIDADPKMVVALNMYDELEASGAKLDYDCLGRMLGIPMIPVVARKGHGLNELLDKIIEVYESSEERVRHIRYSDSVERELDTMTRLMNRSHDELPKSFPLRYWALKMLEGDKEVDSMLSSCSNYKKWVSQRQKSTLYIKSVLDEDIEAAITNEKYGFVKGALKETYIPNELEGQARHSALDSIVTNKYVGFPIFILLMFVMFSATFSLGAYPQEWIERFVVWIGDLVSGVMNDGALKDLLVGGIIGGVGSVIVFLPNILILYMFISLMEDSGYMARAAFIMDKIMHKIGLHGKSFIPLIMGFGCNVPAIMASRTIESRSSRLITILINPFMSCSARLPVFILLAGTFFPKHSGFALGCIYFLGIIVAVLTARLLRRFWFKEDETPFVMELPPYRVPTLNATLRHMWDKCRQYLQKMGGVILLASIVIWFLSYYPHPTNRRVERDIVAAELVADGEEISSADNAATLTQEASLYSAENSYLGRLGRFCEPIIEPLGLNWKAGVALLSGVAAKEIVVSTLGVLYTGDSETDERALSGRLMQSGDFDMGTAVAFMIFILLYCPCLATLTAIANESGRWRWALFSVLYNTAVAWVLAWLARLLINML